MLGSSGKLSLNIFLSVNVLAELYVKPTTYSL